MAVDKRVSSTSGRTPSPYDPKTGKMLAAVHIPENANGQPRRQSPNWLGRARAAPDRLRIHRWRGDGGRVVADAAALRAEMGRDAGATAANLRRQVS
jgi:hypothetical protein